MDQCVPARETETLSILFDFFHPILPAYSLSYVGLVILRACTVVCNLTTTVSVSTTIFSGNMWLVMTLSL